MPYAEDTSLYTRQADNPFGSLLVCVQNLFLVCTAERIATDRLKTTLRLSTEVSMTFPHEGKLRTFWTFCL